MNERMVLLVDADPAIRDSLTTLMDLNGFQVESFSTGSAFLRAVDNVSGHCIICEADLPDTTGIEIFQRLQGAEAQIPFALLVSQRNRNILRTARNAGIHQIFQKPLVHRHLMSFISQC